MKPVAIIFIVTFMAGMLFKPFVPFMEYELNRDFIARVLCINKDKPQRKCNGKCHLGKQLKKAAEQEKNSQQPFSQKKIEWITAVVPQIDKDDLNCLPPGEHNGRRLTVLKGRALPPPTPPPPSKC